MWDSFFPKSCRHGFHHMSKHQIGVSDQSTLVIGFACCFILQIKLLKAHTFFKSVNVILVRFANAVLPNRTCWKKFYTNVWLAFTNVDFLLCYQNICKIGNNLHNFDLLVSSHYTEQFHNKNENCLLAFPINLTVCVEELGKVYSELQYNITPTYSQC